MVALDQPREEKSPECTEANQGALAEVCEPLSDCGAKIPADERSCLNKEWKNEMLERRCKTYR